LGRLKSKLAVTTVARDLNRAVPTSRSASFCVSFTSPGENVGKVDLNSILADVLVPFFFGASQKSVP